MYLISCCVFKSIEKIINKAHFYMKNDWPRFDYNNPVHMTCFKRGQVLIAVLAFSFVLFPCYSMYWWVVLLFLLPVLSRVCFFHFQVLQEVQGPQARHEDP